MAQDKVLNCRDCGADFEFTAQEQEFYAEKGFTNEPGRCPDCRKARKQQQNSGGGFGSRGGNRVQREMHPATCAACGTETQVPFRPSGDRPVYCSNCYTPSNRRY